MRVPFRSHFLAGMTMAIGACAAAAPPVARLVRPPLRPASECTEILARGAQGEFKAPAAGVTPPTPTSVVMPDSKIHGDIPRTGRLDLSFFVGADGRVEASTIVAKGFDGYPARSALIRELAGTRFIPGSVDGCAVRVQTAISYSTGIRR